MADFASNLQRLMARFGLTFDDVVKATDLNERTIKAILNGSRNKPQPRTLHKLARGLGVPADELFQNPSLLARRSFDRQTNPMVDQVAAEHPEWFEGWTETDFEEAYSRMGMGGALTAEGAREVVCEMNRKRTVQEKVSVLMETGEADLLANIVETLYQRVAVLSDAVLSDAVLSDTVLSDGETAVCSDGRTAGQSATRGAMESSSCRLPRIALSTND
jgi:transcriptional regulator with XRE-family HTH domain